MTNFNGLSLPDPDIGEGLQAGNAVTVQHFYNGTIRTMVKTLRDPKRLMLTFHLTSQDEWEGIQSRFLVNTGSAFNITVLGTTYSCKFASDMLQRDYSSHFVSSVRIDLEIM